MEAKVGYGSKRASVEKSLSNYSGNVFPLGELITHAANDFMVF